MNFQYFNLAVQVALFTLAVVTGAPFLAGLTLGFAVVAITQLVLDKYNGRYPVTVKK